MAIGGTLLGLMHWPHHLCPSRQADRRAALHNPLQGGRCVHRHSLRQPTRDGHQLVKLHTLLRHGLAGQL